jgi:hypothetical protein
MLPSPPGFPVIVMYSPVLSAFVGSVTTSVFCTVVEEVRYTVRVFPSAILIVRDEGVIDSMVPFEKLGARVGPEMFPPGPTDVGTPAGVGTLAGSCTLGGAPIADLNWCSWYLEYAQYAPPTTIPARTIMETYFSSSLLMEKIIYEIRGDFSLIVP